MRFIKYKNQKLIKLIKQTAKQKKELKNIGIFKGK